MLCLFITITKEIIYKTVLLYLGSEKHTEGLLKFSRLIYCGPGVFILKVE